MLDFAEMPLFSSFESRVYEVPKSSTDVKFSAGRNLRGCLFVCRAEDWTPENEQFLATMLEGSTKRLGIDPPYTLADDAGVLTLNAETFTNWHSIRANVVIQRAVFFGITPSQIGLNWSVNLYDVHFVDGIPVCFANPIETVKGSPNDKRSLWSAIQALFANTLAKAKV